MRSGCLSQRRRQMAIEKHGNEHIPCTLCDEDALPGTNPPMCARHMKEQLDKKASAEESKPETLKELDNAK